jgi:hypothetical protein
VSKCKGKRTYAPLDKLGPLSGGRAGETPGLSQRIAARPDALILGGGSPGRQLAALFERLNQTEEKLCPTGKPFLFQLSQLSF